ncbi:MAG TPA: hypothetical protein VN669_07255 [Candidatus Acidoferrales bacterium]|jgi:hypothetical protein|nr:hypothetical protein [Candidatus Acidoferrales bacterium]
MNKGILGFYSLAVTCGLVVTLLRAQSPPNPAAFDSITVHRINVVEPDGTLRIVISNHASFPGIIRRGKEDSFRRPQAGMLFYNDEGSENGGLIFAGHKNAKGEVVDSGGSLTFDKYAGGQTVQLAGVDDKDDRFSGMAVNDSLNTGQLRQRVWVGRDNSGAASLVLKDAAGKKRIAMEVQPDGSASLAFFDSAGKVLWKIVPAAR